MTNLLYDTPVHAPTARLDASSGKNLPPKCGKRRPVRIVPAAGMWDESTSSQANRASRPSPPRSTNSALPTMRPALSSSNRLAMRANTVHNCIVACDVARLYKDACGTRHQRNVSLEDFICHLYHKISSVRHCL